MVNVADLWQQVVESGGRPFMVRPSGTVTYGELRALISRACVALQALPSSAGARVAVLLADEAKASAVFVAALLSGKVPVMLPHDIGPARLEAIHRTIEPELVVSDDAIFAASEPASIHVADIPRGELAYLLFTSGTTAAPSGVEITRENLCSHLDTLIRLFDVAPSTRIFNPTPLAHTDGLIFGALLPMVKGATVIRPGPLRLSEMADWLGLMRQHKATHMMTNPTVLSIIERTAEGNDQFQFDGFKGILCGGSLLRADLWNRFEQRFNTQIWNLYGLSETVTTALYSGRHPEMGPVGTLGSPIDCEARIAPPQDLAGAVDDKAVGELQLRGSQIFRGYWRNPERTASTFVAGGWMRTGDLVRRNEDGSFMFLGRIKAAINSGGTLIRGEEVDEAILRHPSVAEAVTVGIPDGDFEEIAVSAVVLKGDADEAALLQHCRRELEALKVPKRIVIVASIPRGDAGKPSLTAVKEMLSKAVRPPDLVPAIATDEIDTNVISLAALVFGVPAESLSPLSGPDNVEGWDSFRHVNFLLQAEDVFDIRIPGALFPTIKTLSDLVTLVRKSKSGG